jgi:hypothetical protein
MGNGLGVSEREAETRRKAVSGLDMPAAQAGHAPVVEGI